MDIERGIPPPWRSGAGRPERYPWSRMKVGDSFFEPGETERERKKMRHLAWSAGKRWGHRYVTMQVDGGIRIWRVE